MDSNEQLTRADQELQAALGRLEPAEVSIDRDRTMFLAGQASVRPSRWLWPSVAATLAVMLVVLLINGSIFTQAQRVVYVEVEQPKLIMPTVGWQGDYRQHKRANYLKLRDAVLEHGLAALPMPTSTGTPWQDSQGPMRNIPRMGSDLELFEHQLFNNNHSGDKL